jgi:riboflavin biosynthesis pyrimidine reductase
LITTNLLVLHFCRAPTARTRLDISSEQSFRLLHSLRACHDAVLVGVNTVFADDPQLNVRDPLPGVLVSYPRPIIIDSELRIIDYPKKLRFVNPIVCTCIDIDSERWKEASFKLSHINGTLINCKKSSTGR